MRLLAVVLVLLISCLSLSCQAANRGQWVVAPHATQQQLRELISSEALTLISVRGEYENGFLLCLSKQQQQNLSSSVVEFVQLGWELENEDVFVLSSNVPDRSHLLPREIGFLTAAVKSDMSGSVRIIGTVKGKMIVGKQADAEYPSWWGTSASIAILPVSKSTIKLLPEYKDTIAGRIPKVYNSKVQALVDAVSRDRLSGNVQHLTAYFSRYALTTSPSTIEAQKWLAQQFSSLGLVVQELPFRSGYTTNVIGELRGTVSPQRYVFIGAHYDSRGRQMNPTTRAPGADDNGSGSSAVLELARVIASSGIKFEHSIRFCLWSGEEQGLYGSAGYAQSLVAEGVDVVAYINADMISYRVPSEPVQVGFDSSYTSRELTSDLQVLLRTYVPDLPFGIATGCCTDSMSFHNAGFLAASLFERIGGIRNPFYHTSEDDFPNSSNDFTQVQKIAQVMMAGVATLAVPVD